MRAESWFALESPSSSSYLLAIVESRPTVEILVALNERIALLQASMKDKEVSKLLLPLALRYMKYSRFQGNSSSQVLLLPHCIVELLDLRFYNDSSRLDVTLAFSKMEG